MSEARSEEQTSMFGFFDPDVSEAGASAALKRIARDEGIKSYVQNETPVHDALLGAAMRFVGGERLGECVEVAQRVNRSGHPVTIDHMGESTRDEATAREATEEFLRVVEAIRGRGLDSSVSLDLSHLGLVVDSELAFENASRLASAAREGNLEVMVSMEGSERTDEVLGMYRRLSEGFENVGITLQAHLRRTPEDLEDALTRPGRIRLVKGAFEEPEDMAMSKGQALDDTYRSFLERLLSSGHPTSVSTHDPVILEHADRFVRENGLEVGTAEFEMLYGVQEGRLEKMRGLGHRTRVYLPYGTEWYLYLCHRLAEHPPNVYRAVADAVDRSYSL